MTTAEIVGHTIEDWAWRLTEILPEQPDLIVLPEACDRPAKQDIGTQRLLEYYADRGTMVRDFFATVAKENACYIAYSSIMTDGDDARNTTQVIDRDGYVVGSYDKNHLVVDESDELGIRYGTQTTTLDLDFGRVSFAICFDLNFEELKARYFAEGPELVVFSSEYHGGLMQQYWAYSLRSYFAGCIRPPAPSGIVSPVGEVLATSTNYFDRVTQQVNLDYAVMHLDGNWRKLESVKHKYGRDVAIHDPGRLGSVLLTSESADRSAPDIVAEFEIELLDEYLKRSRDHRAAYVV